jgi:fumarylacetoacetate (FAA) hydrolase
MKLATLNNGTRDGELVVVSRDLKRTLSASSVVQTMQSLIENWTECAPKLEVLYQQLNESSQIGVEFSQDSAMAPLPRAWQWLDGSAFPQHGELMQKAFGLPPIETDRPLMYQGLSDKFFSAKQDAPFPTEEDGIDFEGEFGVITDEVPLGVSAEEATNHIRLLVQINDWSLRNIAPIEMKTGFGWVQAKPACTMAPVAVTPDELGDTWANGRVNLPLKVDWNGKTFGCANGSEMEFSFHDLIAHAARTRDLVAGTVIGSGTVSNAQYSEVGSSCIAERRAIDIIEFGEPRTPFMSFGDTIKMEATLQDGSSLFGCIEQTVVNTN